MKYIYHYHLIRPRKNGDQNHFFGVLQRTGPIDSVEEYEGAIQFICKQHAIPKKEVIVSNMSLLSATPA
jgi:hypothetical protein